MIRCYKIFNPPLGKTSDLCLEISNPFKDGNDYSTSFSLKSAVFSVSGVVYGVDEIQSLFMCLTRVGDFLYTLEKNEGFSIFWLEEGDDLGLPCSSSVDKIRR